MVSRWVLFSAALVAACGGGSTAPAVESAGPSIDLSFRGSSWNATPVNDALGSVSNNGAGYTGEIDVYVVHVPADGRLQVALHWSHDADYDLILASDREGRSRLAEGVSNDGEPEYLGIDVVQGETVWALVAGWKGEPGPYVLETILVPPGAPVFDVVAGPDLDGPWPANVPLTFTFNVDLDPAQDLADRVLLLGEGRVAQGRWCLDGADLTFLPRLPVAAGDPGGLVPGTSHVLQFRRAGHGIRAATGEYLGEIVAAQFEAAPPADATPGAPPRVIGVSPNPAQVWDGSELTLAVDKPLDPATLAPVLLVVGLDGAPVPVAYRFALEQAFECDGSTTVRITLAPDQALPPGIALRVVAPGTIRALGGDPAIGLTGPFPAPPGAGYQADFPR